MKYTNTTILKASDNYILRKIADKQVLIAVGAGIADFNGYIQLNDTAAFLWTQLMTPHSCDELTMALSEECEISREQAAADVEEFIHELIEQNMVVIYE